MAMTYLMILLHMLAVLVCILLLAWRFRVSLVEVLPVFTCGLVFVLYLLAFLHHLSWIDGVAVLAVAAAVGWFFRQKKEEREAFLCACRYNMTRPSFITGILLLVVVAVCTSSKLVTWWDDFNFWAVDARALYFSDGFAGKYGNVAAAFGDYPPATQLIKWWFLHLNPQEFKEGLAFAGYYTMNLVFLLPLLKKEKGKNVFILLFMAAALWLFPSVGEYFGYNGFCADLTMACIYGAFLYAVTDREVESEVFYYGRLALYLGVLVIVKSIGFVWTLFGLVFFLLYWRSGEGREQNRDGGKQAVMRGLLSMILLPAATGGTWLLFCLLMRRVANSTTTAVKYMVTDEYGLSGYMGEYAAAFVRAFFGSPLHRDESLFINMTPFGCYLCICLLSLLFLKWKLLSGRMGRLVLGFCTVSGALFYGIIFLAHITIFAGETQYLETSGMILSIERYGAPFTIGTLLFLAHIWLNGGSRLFESEKFPQFVRRYGVQLCFILFVALTANYQIGYYGLVGYRDDLEMHQDEREGYLDAQAEAFLNEIEILRTDHRARVYYIRGTETPGFHNVYTSYAAAPASVVYREAHPDREAMDWVFQEIRNSHASYLYADEPDAGAYTIFDGVTQGEAFSCGMLYRIMDDGENIQLTPVSDMEIIQ